MNINQKGYMTNENQIEQTKQKTIVLDVDGVLLRFTPAFDQAAAIFLKREVSAPKDNYGISTYDLMERINGTNEEVDAVLQFMLDSGMYAEFEPLTGAKEAIQALRKAGFKIVICTALPDSAKEMRLENLKNALDFEPDEAYFVGMGQSKKQALLAINPDVYVDDRIKYLDEAHHINHLVWCDQSEYQKEMDSQITTHVHSLYEWTQHHMPKISKELDAHYNEKAPLQISMKLETARMRHRKIS